MYLLANTYLEQILGMLPSFKAIVFKISNPSGKLLWNPLITDNFKQSTNWFNFLKTFLHFLWVNHSGTNNGCLTIWQNCQWIGNLGEGVLFF